LSGISSEPTGCGSGPSCATAASKDALIGCCDGLGGLAQAIEATWPEAIVQTCVI
jgi:hypothetical protein